MRWMKQFGLWKQCYTAELKGWTLQTPTGNINYPNGRRRMLMQCHYRCRMKKKMGRLQNMGSLMFMDISAQMIY